MARPLAVLLLLYQDGSHSTDRGAYSTSEPSRRPPRVVTGARSRTLFAGADLAKHFATFCVSLAYRSTARASMSTIRASPTWLLRCCDAERLARATILIWTGPHRQLRSPASRVLLRPGCLTHVQSVRYEVREEARQHSAPLRRPCDVALEEEVEEEKRALLSS